MTTEYGVPPEEAYRCLLDEEWEVLSDAARTIIKEAQLAAYATNMVHSYCGFQQAEYEEAMGKMHRAAGALAGRDRKILAEIVGVTKAAAASIDPEDRTPAGHKVDRSNVRWYYRMVSGMIEESLKDETFFVRIPQSEG